MVLSTIPGRVGTPTPDAATSPPPRVKLPGVNPAPRIRLPDLRRPITPAPNTWAEAEILEKVTSKPVHENQPTNRERYENRFVSELTTSTSNDANLQQRRHIQPAIPLITTSPLPKNRAVTDPIQHRALLSTRKPSFTQLKKRGKIFEFSTLSTSKVDLSSESSLPSSKIPPKALQLLGVRQEDTLNQQTSNVPSQTTSKGPDFQDGPTSEDLVPTPCSPSMRQAEPSTTGTSFSGQSPLLPVPPVLNVQHSDVAKTYPVPQESSTTHLQLPSIAAPGNDDKQSGAVRQQILHPSKSFQAIIETATPTSPEDKGVSKLEPQMTPTKVLRHERSGEVLRPITCFPNSYNGVWEFDPAVGHTLPPFSPMPKMGHPDHQHVPQRLGYNNVFPNTFRERFPRNPSAMHGDQRQDPRNDSMHMVSQTTSEGHYNEPWQTKGLQSSEDATKIDVQHQMNRSGSLHNASKGNNMRSHPQNSIEQGQHGLQKAVLDSRSQSVFHPPYTPSNNSWATSSTPAAPPPQWPVLQLHNPVPSPPYSQQDYLRPSPLSAGLAQLDMTLHHHIDSIFTSLSRQITDKHDRILDRVLIRIDNLEEKLSKDVKGIKSEMNSVRKELDKMRASAVQNHNSYEATINALQTFDGKLDALEGHIDQIKCKGHIQFADPNNGETNGQRHRHQPPPHHVRSAHGSVDGSSSSGDRLYRLQHRNGTVASSGSPSKSRHSGNSNGSELKGTRSGAVSVSGWQGDEARIEVDRGMGRGKVGGPDLRDHPAYQHQKEAGQIDRSLGLEGETISKQALSEEGWYQQAYGRRT